MVHKTNLLCFRSSRQVVLQLLLFPRTNLCTLDVLENAFCRSSGKRTFESRTPTDGSLTPVALPKCAKARSLFRKVALFIHFFANRETHANS